MKKRALFTAITGDYEKLNELPPVAQGTMDAYCFTDNPNVTSESWKTVVVNSPFPLDPIRSQRFFKILQHEIVRRYEETLYIDNSVLLKVDPHQILDVWLRDAEIAIPEHSYRNNVHEEFDAVIEHRLDTRDRVLEQRNHYVELYPHVLSMRPTWNAMIARRNTDNVAEFERLWFDQLLRYSRRDQLSAPIAAELSHVRLNRVSIDNNDSPFHSWPVLNERKSQIRHDFWPDVSELESRIDDLHSEVESLKSALFEVWGSPSWKFTRPLRAINKLIGRLFKRD
jgi:hypothetical protein